MSDESDEKDRFGDKLRDKQRGDEDRYFAELDRKKLETLRRQDPAVAAAVPGLCPRCGVALTPRASHDVTIDECSSCGGLWLDRGELKQRIEREDEGWAHRWLRRVLGMNR